jgi:hypothetical protein
VPIPLCTAPEDKDRATSGSDVKAWNKPVRFADSFGAQKIRIMAILHGLPLVEFAYCEEQEPAAYHR